MLLARISKARQSLPLGRSLTLEGCNFLRLLALLLMDLLLNFRLAARNLTLKLVRTTHGNITGAIVREEGLEDDLDKVAGGVVDDHDGGHGELELVGKRHQLHLLIDLGDELGRTGKRDSCHAHDAVPHTLILGESLPERAALIVDGECADLLDQLQEEYTAVEQRRRKLGVEINGPRTTIRQLLISSITLARYTILGYTYGASLSQNWEMKMSVAQWTAN